jgi:hypothetical protein
MHHTIAFGEVFGRVGIALGRLKLDRRLGLEVLRLGHVLLVRHLVVDST